MQFSGYIIRLNGVNPIGDFLSWLSHWSNVNELVCQVALLLNIGL